MQRITDPERIALRFVEYINRQDVQGLSGLMTGDHVFIDRKGHIDRGKATMTRCWIEFFDSFPEYKNTFIRVHSAGDLVVLYGYATWHKGGDPDYAIWTATIRDDLVAEWRIYEDTDENKKRFDLA